MLIVCACGFGLCANAAFTYTENWANCENLSRTTCPAQFVGSSGDGSGITGFVQSYSDGSSWAYERYCRHALNMKPGQTATLDFSISTWVGPTSFSINFIAYADSYSTISGGAAQLPNYPAKSKWDNIYSPEAYHITYRTLSSVQYKIVCELYGETSSNRTYSYRIYDGTTLLATLRGTRSKSWSDDSISGLFIITSPSTGNSSSHNYSVSYNIGGWLTWTNGIDPSTQTYTVTYKPGANGTGSQQTATKTYGTALTLKGAIFTRTGYTQTGWATSDGGSKAYDLGGNYTANASITLYPYWESVSAKDPIPELPRNASEAEVLAALAENADAALSANVTNAADYAAYRQWALSVTNGTTTANTIVESSRTWLSFALGAGGLIEKDITSNDVHIVSFGVDDSAVAKAPSPAFAFEVAIDGVEIGRGSVADETLLANLKKVLWIEGSATLLSDAFSPDNIETVFDVPRNGRARFIAIPPAGVGNSFFMRVKVNTYTHEENTHSGHDKVQLWEGGPYWATTNIGAENPEDCGYYFWWGDTVGYKREGDAWVATDGSSSNFSFGSSNTPTYNKSDATLQREGWITADGVLAPVHDAAHVHWGGNWRMPTDQELDNLNSNCDWTWTTQNGVNGYIVRGRGNYASNSIFLPCAGYGDGTSLYNAGSRGLYWSSVPISGSNYAWYLYFNSSDHGTDYSSRRYYGRSVRPVQGFTN